jgi:AbrB family looped-hinge helix DNA binding protein
MHVEVGKEGRIVLPKEIRENKEIEEKTRIIVRERQGEIVLIPVKRYTKPTQSLLGSVKIKEPVDDPKGLAREHAARKALEGIDECDS